MPSFIVFISVELYSAIILITFQREGLVKKPIAASLLLPIFILVACSSFIQPSPTTIPTVTLTVLPTLAPTNTFAPQTETPEATSALLPDGQPASQWNGIPIMPEAITGEGDEESYVFTVKATPQQVQNYYQVELGKLGWQLATTGGEDSSLTLTFNDPASATLTISILSKGEQVLVLLVR